MYVRRHTFCLMAVAALAFASEAGAAEGEAPAQPPTGPFGYSLIRTADGEPADIDFFFTNRDCAVCHERQLKELQGSMHSASHGEPLYRSFAELARKEAGEKIYAFCSGCHAPAGVVTGLIPARRDPELPPEAKAGVTCDVCHQISELTGAEGPWAEPGNASFVIQQGRTRFGHSGEVMENRSHTGEKRDFFSKSEFCASCHTLIHPINGFRIESTYDEWKASIYAKKGIQCPDCHMRTVEDAVKVAETLQPVIRKGQSATEGPERQIFPHFFVGGNANADVLAGGRLHAQMAEARLKSAMRIEVQSPARAAAGKPLELEVLVHNVAAGHHVPTGITEVRQMWIDLQIVDQQGKTLFRSGDLDEQGELRPGAIWFGAVAGDSSGKKTVRPWEMAQFLRKQTVPPKGFIRAKVSAELPAAAAGTITIEAKLLYRSAPPHVIALVMPDDDFRAKLVEMAQTRATVTIE